MSRLRFSAATLVMVGTAESLWSLRVLLEHGYQTAMLALFGLGVGMIVVGFRLERKHVPHLPVSPALPLLLALAFAALALVATGIHGGLPLMFWVPAVALAVVGLIGLVGGRSQQRGRT